MKISPRNSHQSHMSHRERCEPRGNGAHRGHSARQRHRGRLGHSASPERSGRRDRACALAAGSSLVLPPTSLALPPTVLPLAGSPPGERPRTVFGVKRPGFATACMVKAAVARRVTADVSRGAVKDQRQRRSQKQTKRIFRAWLAEARRYRGARRESHPARAAEGAGPAFDYL
jgi:hypothetical protein